MLEAEADALLAFYRHLFPEFTHNHLRIYLLLWREAMSPEEILVKTGLGRGTGYAILKELAAAGLVSKSGTRPAGYFAENPLKAYASNSRRLAGKLEQGKEKVRALLCGAPGFSEELCFVQHTEGQKRLLHKNGRMAITDHERLRQIRDAAERQLMLLEDQKAKTWAVYR